ncbi:hypothetical protein LMG28614_06356 [Paraburkholderia ultramafica]|uniref:Uncharacterized protein n=1 Tax=Paraburkholderia ultramafica TaxID=1544867 RepID=A0A6S7CCS0_9BURK|nr:hypothetical protein LMG28614_06356 [Paraburkholderia ultramafica]
MRDRVRQDAGTSVKRRSTRSHGVWAWLKQDGNQKTLRFLGAAIAAAVALLVSFGVFRKPPPDVAPEASTVSPSQLQSAAPSQSANASGGAAVNVQGSGNYVHMEKP